MTARAPDSESERAAADDVDTVVPLIRARDFDGAIVVEPWALSEETKSRKQSDSVFFVHEISGKLRLHKLVVRKIVIESAYNPVAVDECVFIWSVAPAHRVKTAIVIFAESADVQPKSYPPFVVVRRVEQAIEDFCEGVRRFVFFVSV